MTDNASLRWNENGEIHVPTAHLSGEVHDSLRQQRADVDKVWDRILARDTWWMSLTETGRESGLHDLHQEKAREHGFHFYVSRDVGIVVDKSRVEKGSWEADWHMAVDNDKVVGPGHDLGVLRATWRNVHIGRTTDLVLHAATKGSPVRDREHRVNLEHNRELMRVVGALGRRYGKGASLVFSAGDHNITDHNADVYLGQADFLTLGDELKKWPSTGHGDIDVISSWKPDARVRAAQWRALNDQRFFLHGDHYYAEGAFWVKPVPA